jgi:DNA polymerase
MQKSEATGMEAALMKAGAPRQELRRMVAALRTRLQLDMALNRAVPASSLRKRGVAKRVSEPAPDGGRVERASCPERFPIETAGQTPDPPEQTLENVREALGDCRRCPLCKTRTNLVFGEGHPHAKLVFVGEAPGADEDRQGLPFVGKAGQLLTRIIVAMGLERRDVYICNILKCRPPENRNPRPEEIAACEPFLIRQLQAIGPKMICALGTFSAHTLLKTEIPISQLRGRFHRYQGMDLMPTYHPAYLLRNPAAKRQVWEDVQKIMKAL